MIRTLRGGHWGKWLSFVALLALSIPAIAKDKEDIGVVKRSLEIELEQIEGGKGYEIKLVQIARDGSEKETLFKTETNVWTTQLEPGKYKLSIRSIDSRGVPGDWGKEQPFTVKLPKVVPLKPKGEFVSKEEAVGDVRFKWKGMAGAKGYKLEVFDENGGLVKEDIIEGNKTSKVIPLPVAKPYRWQIAALSDGDLGGEQSASVEFMLLGPRLEKPEYKDIADENTEQIQWTQPDFAEKYRYRLSKKIRGKWRTLAKKTTTDDRALFKQPLKTGTYKIQVMAIADNRKASKVSTEIFKTEFVKRSPAAVEQMRSENSYEPPGRFFLFTSYYVSVLNYQASATTGSVLAVNLSAVGGTGQLGGGYWFSEKQVWGMALHGSLSGFDISSDAVQTTSTGNSLRVMYPSGAMEALYQKRLGGLGKLRVGLGLLYRQMPWLDGSDLQNYQPRTVTTLGPILHARLAHAITQKIGLQVNGMINHSTFGMEMPNGGENQGQLSFQAGVVGSMRLLNSLVGSAGVAYKKDSVGFKSDSEDPKIDLSGIFINLNLEYGF